MGKAQAGEEKGGNQWRDVLGEVGMSTLGTVEKEGSSVLQRLFVAGIGVGILHTGQSAPLACQNTVVGVDKCSGRHGKDDIAMSSVLVDRNRVNNVHTPPGKGSNHQPTHIRWGE
jgi:hypothetical protein